jgi:hypothetical protein
MAVGIENLSKATVAFSKIGSAIGDAFEDKQINIKDIPEAVEIITVLPSFAAIKYSELVAEAKDLDATEKVQLGELFKVNFNIINDDLEATIEEGVDFLFAGFKFLGRFMKKAA